MDAAAPSCWRGGAAADRGGSIRACHQDEAHLDNADNHGGTEDSLVGRHADLAEHQWAVEHDGVDAGRLLEEVHADNADEDPAHARRWPDEQLLPEVASVSITNLWLLDGLLDLLELQVGLGPSRLRTEEHVKLLEYPLFFNNI
jgi:hypothetical protein